MTLKWNADAAPQLVVRADDDREEPTVGRVIGWEDEDRCLVLWGDDRFQADQSRARTESADELRFRPVTLIKGAPQD